MSLYSWCASPYSDDIHSYFKSKELHRPIIRFQSPQPEARVDLVDWIRTVAEKHRFSKLTVHLAVYILDQFMDTHNIASDKLGVVVMVCLMIASKFEDWDASTPPISMMLSILPEGSTKDITPSQVIHLEKFILHGLHWRLGWPTAASFAEYYILSAVVHGDTDPKNTPPRSLKTAVQSSYDSFLDKTLACIDLVNIPPSNVAAACLLAARAHNFVIPLWPESLCKITQYSQDQLIPVSNLLLNIKACDGESEERRAQAQWREAQRSAEDLLAKFKSTLQP